MSLNYNDIPKCRTNNYIENYNGYLKKTLGRKRLISWMTFINFIKNESVRVINKLYKGEDYNFNNNMKMQIIIIW